MRTAGTARPRILNFHLARNPEIAFLWNMADNYSNLLNPELSISCPFILTLTLVVEDQVKTHSEANLKYMDLEKKSKTSYAKWFPSVEKEAKEWGELRQRLGSGPVFCRVLLPQHHSILQGQQ
ncbi:TraC [Klebsiella pneumoniae]|uniref:TraC n=1 Tax=Klebsiella pneumoniae TaxID=573 RepID=A0A2X1QIP2_KLEPN|nr:TraC [Klebsiella pneumoniae]